MPDKANADIAQILNDPSVPQLYFNGFLNATSNGDVLIIVVRNTKPIAVLNASYTIAKTLGKKLNELIEQFESQTDHKIMEMDYVAERTKPEEEAQ